MLLGAASAVCRLFSSVAEITGSLTLIVALREDVSALCFVSFATLVDGFPKPICGGAFLKVAFLESPAAVAGFVRRDMVALLLADESFVTGLRRELDRDNVVEIGAIGAFVVF